MCRDSKGRFNSEARGNVTDRFNSNIVRIPIGGCWVWIGALKNRFGHGAFKVGSRNSKVEFAHRFAWVIKNGEIPRGMCVCHHCDNPSCVNPDHLFLGTQTENHNDMVSKGRMVKGSKCKGARLTESLVSEIKKMCNLPSKKLASMFNISRQSISDIKAGRTWKHV